MQVHDLPTALAHYEAALALDSTDYEANWRAVDRPARPGRADPRQHQEPRARLALRPRRAPGPAGRGGRLARRRRALRAGRRRGARVAQHGQEGADPPRRASSATRPCAPSPSTRATTGPTTSWAAGTRRSCGSRGSAASSRSRSSAPGSSARRRGRRRSPTWSRPSRWTRPALPPPRAGARSTSTGSATTTPGPSSGAGGPAGPRDHGQRLPAQAEALAARSPTRRSRPAPAGRGALEACLQLAAPAGQLPPVFAGRSSRLRRPPEALQPPAEPPAGLAPLGGEHQRDPAPSAPKTIRRRTPEPGPPRRGPPRPAPRCRRSSLPPSAVGRPPATYPIREAVNHRDTIDF